MQRRCYWLLEGDDNVVLVHYLSSNPQENCVMRGPPPNGGALSLNAVEIPRPAPQVFTLANPLFMLPCLGVGASACCSHLHAPEVLDGTAFVLVLYRVPQLL